MSSPSHDTVLRSAGRLFEERGYRAVTVRDIAADAGVSAALVMKVFLSNEKLYVAVQPDESLLTELIVPTSGLGRTPVFRVLMRRERGRHEPGATIPFAVLDSPDPEAVRADVRERCLAAMALLIGDTSPASPRERPTRSATIRKSSRRTSATGPLPSRPPGQPASPSK